MSSLPLGMIIEALVAVLLLITIGYCWMLNRRLQRLRADEQVLRATISELMTATEIAERAILGLKTTAAEADKTLGSRLKQAETMSHTLAEHIGEGEKVFTRISQIADAARSAAPPREAAARSEGYVPRPMPDNQSYAPPVHAPEPEQRRSSRASDIRSAAAEATARLEQFRKRNGAAA
ncbi:MAG: DUF6468 domain-containing protein [Roseibium sp.]